MELKRYKTETQDHTPCHFMRWTLLMYFPHPSLGSSSYSKRGGQADNRTVAEDSGRKGSSGSSTTKVPASPLVPSDRKKSATPSTVRHYVTLHDIMACCLLTRKMQWLFVTVIIK